MATLLFSNVSLCQRLYELHKKDRISVSAALKLLSNDANTVMGLSVGSMVMTVEEAYELCIPDITHATQREPTPEEHSYI